MEKLGRERMDLDRAKVSVLDSWECDLSFYKQSNYIGRYTIRTKKINATDI